MLMMKILENDLHRSKRDGAVPLFIEVPALANFLPAIVSDARGGFLTSRRMTGEGRIRVGVFNKAYSSMDKIVKPMLKAALDLSVEEKWPNVFMEGDVSSAFDYVQKHSCMPFQPHVCLVPRPWSEKHMLRIFGQDLTIIGGIIKYRERCRIIRTDTPSIVFLSRPDMVGLCTRFHGSTFAAVILHNIKKGISFAK